ncbi:MBL fold metallo-hydrolase [Pedobacter nutrimenti]|uniref:Phosphoribosyl 1,2-cyclic phosphate phosphodiesterase n=1 Tax=Pedobacter nutrimenti TaxID=1241337 RepID=A0A318UCG4_9SPHI|nr:MBL fold metallo-hydrolase [Pedobacter nutrimenti]PYF71642.1 phosphoribosyl 1,2-cyclic phosphate phosphodiesterase [Pedobacter nutrimenti]
MKLTFLGTGTSQGIPVIGCSCEICTSSDPRNKRLRTSMLVETADKTVVIDSGPDFRYQMLRAGVKDLDAIVFTHEHKDHIAGLDDIRPFNYLLKKNIDIYADHRVEHALRREFSYIFSDVTYPGLPQINLHEISGMPFQIGETTFIPIEVMHYKLPIFGFRIHDFTYITDAKTISDAAVEKIKGSKILVVNALQVSEHISHFTLEEAVEFAERVNAEMTYLTHISHNLGLHQEVEKALPAHIRLAYDGLTLTL